MSSEFVHLHVHTEYSLLDGQSRIGGLIDRAIELDMPAVGISDHGVMFGVIDFYRAAKSADVKPVIGMEAYLAPRTRFDKDAAYDKRPYHMLLFAKNNTGYRNLMKLASLSQLEGYYYRPRIDWDLLSEYSEGIIASSGCLAAEIPRLVEDGRDEEARQKIGQYLDVFGAENFYLELQPHSIDQLDILNKWLVEYRKSNHTDVQFYASNDVHYVYEKDADVHDTLLCIQTGSLKSEDNRMKMNPSTSYFMKTADEMRRELLAMGMPEDMIAESFRNSLKIAEMTNVDLDDRSYKLPVFPVPPEFNDDSATYLRYLVKMGLGWRYPGQEDDPVLIQRMERELGIIGDMGFNTYFLIVWDLCEFAREADIWWNVRGSGAGSLVAYCLGITNIDPIQNSLLFERFLNPGRVSMPDIDLDYPDDRRGEMIAYAADKYGKDKVAAIITFGTMGAKAAVKDVGRALGVDSAKVNHATSMIPQEARQKKIAQYIELNPELQEFYDKDAEIKRVMDTAIELQGMTRHASTHAAGVIIADKPLDEYTPLHRITGTDPSGGSLTAVTQFPMETAESIGLLKVDFLGLSTLTILRKACDLINKHHGTSYNMDNVPYRHDDMVNDLTDEEKAQLDEAFEMMGRGETVGVFQVESPGMQQMLRGMRPQKFEHIIAGISLYRPGPMEFIPDFNDYLHGTKTPEYKHEKLKKILSETFSIIVYQEQIMQIAGELFGYDLGEADLMRRAVSKKKAKALKEHKEIFMERGPDNGIPADISEAIFDEIEFFANYGFNKCVVGDTEIIDADTGRIVTIQDLYDKKVSVAQTVTTDTDTLCLRDGSITDVMSNGVKPVYKLTTQTGRTITATDNHPFYTFDGWQNLGDLCVGERIATPRSLPIEGSKIWDKHKLIVLGHLLAEGNLCHPTGIYYYTGDEAQWQDYVENLEKFDNTIASTHHRHGMHDVYSKRINRSEVAEVVTWIEELGLRYKNSYTKFIPQEIFELKNEQISLLIARMWEGDGHINEKGRSLYYATSSVKMARQLQHLFLRLNIVASLRKVIFPYKEGRTGYQLFITGNDNFNEFMRYVGKYFISDERKHTLTRMILEAPKSSGMKDIIPIDVKHIVRREKALSGSGWEQIKTETGLSTSTFSRLKSDGKIGFTRPIIAAYADYFDSTELRKYSDNDIYWDEVISIEYVGEEPTYDLTIADTHNFVANDIIVHNSHASDYAVITVQTAFLKCHYPAEYMTALLSVQFDNSEKVATFLEECRRLQIPVLPPHINYSDVDFDIETTPDGKRGIRFGMGAIKNASVGALQHIIDERQAGGQFNTLAEFCQRVDLRQVGKRTIESLIKVGAFGKEWGARDDLLYAVERIVGFSADYHHAQEVGQMSLFGEATGMEAEQLAIGEAPKHNKVKTREQLGWEKELMGLYVTGRPVDNHAEVFRAMGNLNVIADLKSPDNKHRGEVRVAGEIVTFRKIFTKQNKQMAVMSLEDWHESAGIIDIVIFPDTWEQVKQQVYAYKRNRAEGDERIEITPEMQFELDEGDILEVRGSFDDSRGDVQIICRSVDFESLSLTPEQAQEIYQDNGSPRYVTQSQNGNHTSNGGSYSSDGYGSDSEPPPMEYTDEGDVVLPDNQPTPALATSTSVNGNQNETKSYGDAPKWATDEHPATQDTDDTFADLRGDNLLDSKAPVHVEVHIERSRDTDKDRRRLRIVHNALLSYPGKDTFSIVIHGGKKPTVMDFPNHTTGMCDTLLEELIAVVDQEAIRIHDK